MQVLVLLTFAFLAIGTPIDEHEARNLNVGVLELYPLRLLISSRPKTSLSVKWLQLPPLYVPKNFNFIPDPSTREGCCDPGV
jgi:hypothetical protein